MEYEFALHSSSLITCVIAEFIDESTAEFTADLTAESTADFTADHTAEYTAEFTANHAADPTAMYTAEFNAESTGFPKTSSDFIGVAMCILLH